MARPPPIYLPALKGFMGVNFYYVALMTLGQVRAYIKVGDEIYQSRRLSEMMQRALKSGREQEIADYLTQVKERFFNAMVVGVYGGKPDWKPFELVNRHPGVDVSALRLDAINSFGFLEFTGREKLFPLDGQHRLIGIRAALARTPDDDLSDEEMTVIFLAHDEKTKAGRERSRRLFTVLNKRAKPVDKNEIIALDEDDVMAIVTRELVEHYGPLLEDRVLFTATAAIRTTQAPFTTIGALYDTLGVLFEAVSEKPRKELENARPSDAVLGYFSHAARAFFAELAHNDAAFAAFAEAGDFGAVTAVHRSADGGNLIFRPIGLKIFAQVVANLLTEASLSGPDEDGRDVESAKRKVARALKSAVARVSALPMSISGPPFAGTLWNPETRRIQAGRASLARDLMLDALGRYPNRERLRVRYAKALGREGERVRLPADPVTPRIRRRP